MDRDNQKLDGMHNQKQDMTLLHYNLVVKS